jgi:hypothetical protein
MPDSPAFQHLKDVMKLERDIPCTSIRTTQLPLVLNLLFKIISKCRNARKC